MSLDGFGTISPEKLYIGVNKLIDSDANHLRHYPARLPLAGSSREQVLRVY
jgi:hypothetical protein